MAAAVFVNKEDIFYAVMDAQELFTWVKFCLFYVVIWTRAIE